MFKLSSLFKRNTDASQEKDAITEARNWYSDRYQTTVVQRNILLLITLLSLAGVFISVFTVRVVTESKSIEPFVVEIEKKSGLTNVVDPSTRSPQFADEALIKYFVVKYVTMRETYDPVTYNYNYFTVVRLLSRKAVYDDFTRYIASDPKSPRLMYGETTKSVIKIRYVVPQPDDRTKVKVQFTLQTVGPLRQTLNKIATVQYDFLTLEMNQEERLVNPLGFQVIGYRVDDEAL